LALYSILLTSFNHVNLRSPEFKRGRIQNGVVGTAPDTAYFAELTVPHKTVAEPH